MLVYAPANHTFRRYMTDLNESFFGRTVDDVLKDGWLDTFEANAREERDGYTLEIAVPGMSRKDISIYLTDHVLKVTAQRQETSGGWRKQEFSRVTLNRTFTLPADADKATLRARCRHGLLVIRMKKIESRRGRIIPVTGTQALSEAPVSRWRQLKQKMRRAIGRLRGKE